MIIKKLLPSGEKQYFDVLKGGIPIHLKRGAPCNLRKLPDYVFQYISPAPSKKSKDFNHVISTNTSQKSKKSKVTLGAFGKQKRIPQKH